MQRKTGARGLRTILETVLLDTMYELPSMRNVAKVVIDETVIEGQTKPYVVYRSEDGTQPAPRVDGAESSLTGFRGAARPATAAFVSACPAAVRGAAPLKHGAASSFPVRLAMKRCRSPLAPEAVSHSPSRA